MRQAIPTRLKAAFWWNMNSWQLPKSSREDPKMRRMKKLLKSGPVLLQETKWRRNQEEILLQHISGLQLATTNAIRTGSDSASGGAAVLLLAGWVISQQIVLLEGRAIAVLVSDRSAPFYLISIYLHPDHVQNELEQIISAWRNVEKNSDKVVLGGDFNQADVKCPETWKKFLMLFCAVDVHPMLATYLYTGGSSALDRFLVPEDWVSTARWNPEVRTLHSSLANGHKILKLNVKVRPAVLNNPNDSLHDTILTEAFMPGKNGRIPKDNRSLQSLVRLLHRTHKCLFDGTLRTNGFRLDCSVADPCPVGAYQVPPFSVNDMPNQLLPKPSIEEGCAARELHSTRDEQAVSSGCDVQITVDDATYASAQEQVSHCLEDCIGPSRGDESPDCSVPAVRVSELDAGTSTQAQVMYNAHLSISA